MNYSNVIAGNHAKISVIETMLTGMRYSPLRMPARHMDANTRADRPTHIDAVTDGNRIWLRRGLAQAQRRSVLAHQLVHAERDPVPAFTEVKDKEHVEADLRPTADRLRRPRRSLGTAPGSGPRRHRRRMLVRCHNASCAKSRVHATRNRVPASQVRANRGRSMTEKEVRILAFDKHCFRYGGSKDTALQEKFGNTANGLLPTVEAAPPWGGRASCGPDHRSSAPTPKSVSTPGPPMAHHHPPVLGEGYA